MALFWAPFHRCGGFSEMTGFLTIQRAGDFVTLVTPTLSSDALRNVAAKDKEPLALPAHGWCCVQGPWGLQRPGKEGYSSPWWASSQSAATLPNPPMQRRGKGDSEQGHGLEKNGKWRTTSEHDQLHTGRCDENTHWICSHTPRFMPVSLLPSGGTWQLPHLSAPQFPHLWNADRSNANATACHQD